jgi:hypothetical protein
MSCAYTRGIGDGTRWLASGFLLYLAVPRLKEINVRKDEIRAYGGVGSDPSKWMAGSFLIPSRLSGLPGSTGWRRASALWNRGGDLAAFVMKCQRRGETVYRPGPFSTLRSESWNLFEIWFLQLISSQTPIPISPVLHLTDHYQIFHSQKLHFILAIP